MSVPHAKYRYASPRSSSVTFLLFFFSVGQGCGGAETAPAQAPVAIASLAPNSPSTPATPALAPVVVVPALVDPKRSPVSPVVAVKDVGFATPESVIHDAEADVYLVSNINGPPGASDGNGFISKVSPEGRVLELKWIEGGKNGAKLDAPKGMALVGDMLYVADITTVRTFDRKTGKPAGEVKLPGSTFVNDLAARAGKVYASDSGIKFSEKGAEPTKTDSVWLIEKGKAKRIVTGESLGKPNGLLATETGVWVVTFGSGELYRIEDSGTKSDTQKLPKGSLDGIVAVGDSFLVSSWEAGALFKGKPGGTFEGIVDGLKAPADIGYDAKRSRVLVPLFNDNAIAVYDVR